ncbi:hypothetical protein BO94DRAFT_539697 [Aspergillus sclerotioniger CBS 115572]|uniref:Secreted protein n=1 Tax=Aspergillus sclerotioniger CBS 115572 TaxID=1450535 RepID=A0A317VG60_9EURO|nr:hypothetical protein BO94DRAFT_539697 [Aspergillus sclerotioniger CBS 115572]PWY70820.1 hypothetical protein BO94DRAFT_539697 [Aspergillus sclerotioniger CBS 115572]
MSWATLPAAWLLLYLWERVTLSSRDESPFLAQYFVTTFLSAEAPIHWPQCHHKCETFLNTFLYLDITSIDCFQYY